MVRVHPQDTLDVPLAARREASYDCQFVLDAVRPVAWVDPADPDGAAIDDTPLGRLAGSVEQLLAVSASFGLSLDDYGRPCLQGSANARVVLPCQRCLEDVEMDIQAELGSVIWQGTEPPTELAQSELDVILCPNSQMSYAALIEDDLLLALPQQVCQLEDCPRLPALQFPAPGFAAADRMQKQSGQPLEEEDTLADDRQRPFTGLRDLLNSNKDE